MRFWALLLVVLFARVAESQAPDTARATVSGVVYDSLSRGPLAGAVVQLVAADASTRFNGTAISDSLGRFSIAAVPAGRYMLGFLHATLDSLGMEPPLRELNVVGRAPVRADLGLPSPARLRTAICGPRALADSVTLVVGVVRDARDHAAAANASVIGMWVEFALSRGRLERNVPRLTAKTAANGWYALCNVPSAGTVALIASRGADSTDLIELEMPPDRFLRRDLYIGAVRIVNDTLRTDSLGPLVIRRRVGDERLTGVVVTAEGGRPVPEALVRVRDGPETRANERGEWSLTGAPVGTRMLDVRAVGYYPTSRAVDVVAGGPPVRIALMTMKAVLDTVKVVAERLSNRNMVEFNERRRGGMGRFLTAADIERRRPIVTSDLFLNMAGLRLERTEIGDTQLLMRGTFAEVCVPNVYIDGRYMRGMSADDINGWVKPGEIAGMEVYVGPHVPAQFNTGLAGGDAAGGESCGAIVFWTKSAVPTGRSPDG